MSQRNPGERICYLCGEKVEKKATDEDLKSSKDHVPPKLFFPKSIMRTTELNLRTLQTHKKCNESFREDEEYFMHAHFITMMKTSVGKLFAKDFRKTYSRPQGKVIVRMILNEFDSVTVGGIHLPNDKVVQSLDSCRVDRVIRKIVCGLFFIENGIYLPHETPMDIQFFTDPKDVPEPYMSLCRVGKAQGEHYEAFWYRYLRIPDFHCWSMCFWESFVYCVVFPG